MWPKLKDSFTPHPRSAPSQANSTTSIPSPEKVLESLQQLPDSVKSLSSCPEKVLHIGVLLSSLRDPPPTHHLSPLLFLLSSSSLTWPFCFESCTPRPFCLESFSSKQLTCAKKRVMRVMGHLPATSASCCLQITTQLRLFCSQVRLPAEVALNTTPRPSS